TGNLFMRDKARILRFLALTASLAMAGIAAPAHAFSDDEARKAILELRQQVQQLRDQNRRANLQLADQIQSLQQEVAKLRGQVETVSYRPPAAGANGQQPSSANGPQA